MAFSDIRRRTFRRRLELDMPPLEMRQLIGRPEPEEFDPPREGEVFPTIGDEQFEFMLDFGCGCGRIARQVALAGRPRVGRYVGTDLHAGMIRWACEHLTPALPNFLFVHHDVYNPGFNPNPELPRVGPLPVQDGAVTFMLAYSVFTHLVQDQAEHYLDEVRRVLRHDGVLLASFFLFEKRYFPMMQPFQSALYINDIDPTNAVMFDREWLVTSLDLRGLRIRAARPPEVRGFQWYLEIVPGQGSVSLPEDRAPFGHHPPPVCGRPPHLVGDDALPEA